MAHKATTHGIDLLQLTGGVALQDQIANVNHPERLEIVVFRSDSHCVQVRLIRITA